MLLKMWCGLLSIALLVTSIGCQTGGAMRSLKKTTVVEQLEYFKKGDGIRIVYFDLQNKKKKVAGVIREITQEEIVLWGDTLKNEPDTHVDRNRIHQVDFWEPENQVQDATKGIIKTVGAIALVVGVVALTIYVVKKNTDEGGGDGDLGDLIDAILGEPGR